MIGSRGTLQTQRLHRPRGRTEDRLGTAACRFIEMFRVRHRQDATLGCLNPEPCGRRDAHALTVEG